MRPHVPLRYRPLMLECLWYCVIGVYAWVAPEAYAELYLRATVTIVVMIVVFLMLLLRSDCQDVHLHSVTEPSVDSRNE